MANRFKDNVQTITVPGDKRVKLVEVVEVAAGIEVVQIVVEDIPVKPMTRLATVTIER